MPNMAPLERITVDPNQCGGRPCIRGMRIRVTDILAMLSEGVSHEEILRDFPTSSLMTSRPLWRTPRAKRITGAGAGVYPEWNGEEGHRHPRRS